MRYSYRESGRLNRFLFDCCILSSFRLAECGDTAKSRFILLVLWSFHCQCVPLSRNDLVSIHRWLTVNGRQWFYHGRTDHVP